MKTIEQRAQEVFSQFSPFIRDYIYRVGWDELRRIQILAAEKIFFDDCHLLLSSQTSSGKTEAALFPILSLMDRESPEQFQVLYISPLKSLINDQYSRMEELLRESGMPVFRWHGDTPRSHKEAFLKNPRGMLQITPESLESMLVKRNNDIPRLFGNLKYVIIDEIHALMGTDRGNQILCQLQRLSRLISYEPRRIALSATIGDPSGAENWLASGSDREAKTIKISSDRISWKLALEHFIITQAEDHKFTNSADEFIYRATQGDKCVVFSNSREETEEITANLRHLAIKKGEPDRFYIHHGNLSAAIRQDTESVLKNDERAITACATVTLELGIDIGKLKRVINQSAPTSVSGFLQRLGRSGRRDDPPEMVMTFREEEPLSNAPIFQLIPWDLLQGIAIIELYRRERWIEPASEKPLPASLLFHQTLSVLASNGSLTPAQLASRVLPLAPFQNFTRDDYKLLLSSMLKNDYLSWTDEKELILGLKGEKLLNHYQFFAVFKDSQDFTVRCGSEEIGTVASSPPIGERFALAGRVWEVEDIDSLKRVIYVKSVEGKMKISWPGDQGCIHTKILEMMRTVLREDEDYPYLLPNAKERLKKARILSRKSHLTDNFILPMGNSSFVFFPWLGTKAFRTMKRILQKHLASCGEIFDVQSGSCYYITFRSERLSPSDVISRLKDYAESSDNEAKSLLNASEYPIIDKFDACLPQELLLKAYANNALNLSEAKERIISM